jgi:alpha-tubulin suppressor-like RCC1 family protein
MREVRRSWAALLTVGMLIAGASIAPSASASSFGLFAWGLNEKGQLGDGTTETSESPIAVSGLEGVTSVAGGEGHGLALMAGGTVMAWGSNEDGQLGDGTHEGSDVPVPVTGLEDITAVAAGGYSSYALLSDGTVMAWGENNDGQLGDGTTEGSDVAVPVEGLTGVTAISAGTGHADALLSDGSVVAWGENDAGQLGDGDTANSDVPVAVRGLTGVTAISAGYTHSLALISGGTVRAWGGNDAGQLGDGNERATDVPVAVKDLGGAVSVSAGDEYSLAVLSSGTVDAWGSNAEGKLGWRLVKSRGLEPNDSRLPVEVTEWRSEIAEDAVSVAAGHDTSMALLRDGNAVSWGQATNGERGYPDPNGRGSVALEIPGLCDVGGIAAGWDFGLAYREPGPCPVLSGIDPDSGPEGTPVTIEGSGLDEATAVDFSGTSASIVASSPTSISAVAPPGLTGVVQVTVTTSHGTSTNSLSYEYPPAPTVKSIGPTSGPAAGGTRVTISGAGFLGASQVTFGGVPASGLEVLSGQQIIAVSPPGKGKVGVVVTTPDGSSAVTKKTELKYKK